MARNQVADIQVETQKPSGIMFAIGKARLIELIDSTVQSLGVSSLTLGCLIADVRLVLEAEFPARTWQPSPTKGQGLCAEHLGHVIARSQADKLAKLADWAREHDLIAFSYAEHLSQDGSSTYSPQITVTGIDGESFVEKIARYHVGVERAIAVIGLELANNVSDVVDLMDCTIPFQSKAISNLQGWPRAKDARFAMLKDAKLISKATAMLKPKDPEKPDLSGYVREVAAWPDVADNDTALGLKFDGVGKRVLTVPQFTIMLEHSAKLEFVLRALKKASEQTDILSEDSMALAIRLSKLVNSATDQTIELPDGRRVVILEAVKSQAIKSVLAGEPVQAPEPSGNGKRKAIATA